MPLLELAADDDVQGLGLEGIFGSCQFFIVEAKGGKLGYALVIQGSELWIQGAGGKAQTDLTEHGLAVIEAQAKATKLSSVGFQTRRKGLVKKAEKHGYVVDGWILRKKIK